MSVDPSQFAYSPLQSGVNAAPGSQASLSQGQQLINQQLAQQQKRLQGGEDLSNTGYAQAAGANEEESKSYSALKDLLLKTQQRLGDLQYAPSPQEALLKSASAFAGAKPGLGGLATAGAAAAQSGAETLQQQREGALQREQLMSKYGIDAAQADQMANQLKMQMANNLIAKGQQQQNNATTGINSALGRQTSLDVAGANQAAKPVQVNVNGQQETNKQMLDYEGQLARAKMMGATNPQGMTTYANMIANGDAPIPSGYALTKPGMAGALQLANEISQQKYGTEVDGTIFPAKQKAQNNFAAGQNAQTINSLGVGLQHLGVIEDISHTLDNAHPQIMNTFLQAVQKQFGLSTAPTNFDAAMDIVRAEIPKAIVGGRTALADREEASKVLSRVQTPEQLAGALQTVERLFAGQLTGQRAWYERAVELGRPSGTFDQKFLGGYPGALQILKPLEASGQVQPRDVSDANEGNVSAPVHVKTIEEARALPPDTPFIGPDNVRRRTPKASP
jgi:hypothetical protein